MSDPLDLAALIAFSSTALVMTRMMSRVAERTTALRNTNEQLRAEMVERRRAEEAYNKAQADLTRVTRIMTMGELAASIAHEVDQPISAIVINGNSCLRWLAGAQPRRSPGSGRSHRPRWEAVSGVAGGDRYAKEP